jgi:hypothetical protein
MDLGINMNNDFTIFLNVKLTAPTSTQNILKLFELYATKDNIGLYAHVIKDDHNNNYIKLSSAFSEDLSYKISNNNFSLFDNQFHLITIVKNSEFLKLYIDNYLDNNFNLPAQTEINVFNNKFSNAITNILDNTTNNSINHITHFGIYNKALTINKGIHEVTVLYDYIQKIILKESSIYNDLLTDFNKLKNDIKLSKENPFNSESINKKCSMITDWSNFNDIIQNADDNCLKSINDYCQTDTNFEQCKIWNSFQKLVPYFTTINNPINEKTPIDLIDISINNDELISINSNELTSSNNSNNPKEEISLSFEFEPENKNKETFINIDESKIKKYNKIFQLYNLNY